MKRLKNLQGELPTSALLNRHQSINLKGGGDKRKDRPSEVISAKVKVSKVIKVKVKIGIGG